MTQHGRAESARAYTRGYATAAIYRVEQCTEDVPTL